MFQVGDKIAHPMHGAGVVDSIVEKKINDKEMLYYVLKIPVGGMLVMIPADSTEEIGVRPIVSRDEAEKILENMATIETEMVQNWNHRYRENMMRIKSGDLLEVARVVKSLMLRDQSRGLSTGERKMLHSAKQILLSELVMALGCTYEELETRISDLIEA
ncbi:MAG: CarD family transcriptional regulator [Oscillospiraceae bacterium]|nr:CarD family transcriptional regulator [Oscillospiraceae bacterium]